MSATSTQEKIEDLVATFKSTGRLVIVGASLAGLRAAEALRKEGFAGPLTIIGDEPEEPYDRPPLSKQVLKGWVPADHTKLPRVRQVDAEWRLGIAATGLDRVTKQVRLANGEQVPYDRLLIATGTRAREWPNAREAALEGVFTIRTSTDSAGLQKALAAKPGRVLVIGAGFIGSEVAPVTSTVRGSQKARWPTATTCSHAFVTTVVGSRSTPRIPSEWSIFMAYSGSIRQRSDM